MALKKYPEWMSLGSVGIGHGGNPIFDMGEYRKTVNRMTAAGETLTKKQMLPKYK